VDREEPDRIESARHSGGGRVNKGLFIVPKNPPAPKEELKTYVSSGRAIIRSEFSDRLEELTIMFTAEYMPGSATETGLVRDLAAAQCRCEYAMRLQQQPGVEVNEKMMATLKRYRSTNQGTFKRSLRLLKKIQKERLHELARKPRLVRPRRAGEY
jgi:hypothetical protein